ncbi:MAG: NUDIX domain-containing protein [Candidatus Edwardsbacteria bacterium]|nr:NUDIX domain-containing protein [Candidatus Edwardsbacteria bacterium]
MRTRRIGGHRRQCCQACGHIVYVNPTPAVGVIMTVGGKLIMVRRKYEPRAGLWSLPAGFMEYGEMPAQCAIRESREETGARIKLTKLVGVYSGLDDPRCHAILIVFEARPLNKRLTAGDDASEIGLFPFDDLPRDIAFRAHRLAIRDYLKAKR